MNNIKTSSSNEEDCSMERYVEFDMLDLDAKLELCASCKRTLSLTRKHPLFLRIFSSEEIVRINMINRGIPEMEESIVQLKESPDFQNPNLFSIKERKEILSPIRSDMELLSSFVDSVRSRIPDSRPGPIHWIFYPYDSIKYFFVMNIYRIKIRIQEKRKKKEKERTEMIREKMRELKKLKKSKNLK